jgi:transcriptional regulator with XRE-family HTH domain
VFAGRTGRPAVVPTRCVSPPSVTVGPHRPSLAEVLRALRFFAELVEGRTERPEEMDPVDLVESDLEARRLGHDAARILVALDRAARQCSGPLPQGLADHAGHEMGWSAPTEPDISPDVMRTEPPPGRSGFGSALREARRRSGLRQEDLARQLGIAQPTLSAWELAKAVPQSPQEVFRLESMLGCPAGHLSCHLGYVPIGSVEVDVVAAIRADEHLARQLGEQLVVIYRTFRGEHDGDRGRRS